VIVPLAPGPAVIVDVVAWCVLGVGIGFAGQRLRPESFERSAALRWLARPRRFERDGRFYERVLRIRRWKRWLPDAGATFEGGVAKRSLARLDVESLDRLRIETLRAEAVHVALLVVAPAFVLWNPPGLAVVMLVYAAVANVPCLVAQRYNRLRVCRILSRRRTARRGGRL